MFFSTIFLILSNVSLPSLHCFLAWLKTSPITLEIEPTTAVVGFHKVYYIDLYTKNHAVIYIA